MKRYVIGLALVIITSLSVWGLYKAYRAFKISIEPTACVCVISPLSSEQASLSLQELLKTQLLEKKASFIYTVRLVQQTFPHCSSIVCRQQPSGLVQARIELDEPFFLVNNDAVLTTRGMLVSRSVYDDAVLAGLPLLCAENLQLGTLLSPSLFAFVQQIPDVFLATHTIKYRSDNEIYCTQSDATQPLYLCAVDTRIDTNILENCTKVLADYEQQKTISKKKTRTALVLDLRFDKQIILYPHMGGQVHG